MELKLYKRRTASRNVTLLYQQCVLKPEKSTQEITSVSITNKEFRYIRKRVSLNLPKSIQVTSL